MTEFTDEQREIARRAVRDYERRITMIWDDLEFELEMKLGLEPEEVEALLRDAI